jgi:hypothetical protein
MTEVVDRLGEFAGLRATAPLPCARSSFWPTAAARVLLCAYWLPFYPFGLAAVRVLGSIYCDFNYCLFLLPFHYLYYKYLSIFAKMYQPPSASTARQTATHGTLQTAKFAGIGGIYGDFNYCLFLLPFHYLYYIYIRQNVSAINRHRTTDLRFTRCT